MLYFIDCLLGGAYIVDIYRICYMLLTIFAMMLGVIGMGKWAFVWSEESTKRGVVLVVSGLAVLLGVDSDNAQSIGVGIVAFGQAVAGAIAVLRSDGT